MAPPSIQSAFLSVQPLEPVLIFASSDDAAYFQSHCKQGRILPSSQKWVYLPMPEGLLRARTTRNGDVAFDFDHKWQAEKFNGMIRGLGRIYQGTKDHPGMERTVYLGKSLR